MKISRGDIFFIIFAGQKLFCENRLIYLKSEFYFEIILIADFYFNLLYLNKIFI